MEPPYGSSANDETRSLSVGAIVEQGELFNVASHAVGFVLAAVGTLFLVVPPIERGEVLKAVVLSGYGAGLVAVFLASVLFHAAQGRPRQVLRRLDRSAIYICIGATYSPVVTVLLPPSWSLPVLGIVWALAVYGVALEWIGSREAERHSVNLYRLLGWMSLPLLAPLAPQVGWIGSALVVVGGVLYSVGSVAVRLKSVRLSHELWHVLVLAAAGLHYAFMLIYVA